MICRVFVLLAITAFPGVCQVRFEVASIHPSRPDAGPRDARINMHGNSFNAEASTVSDILDMLNGWQLHRVTGGPGWMGTARYDIHAKADAELIPESRKDAILGLLQERFQLAVHVETREIPTTVLLAPKRPKAIQASVSGETYSLRFDERHDPTFTAAPMFALTNYLSQMWHSAVVDETGLQGTFDFSLKPSAIEQRPGENWGDRVREALLAAGFKMEIRKVPTEMTVVDRCERPSAN